MTERPDIIFADAPSCKVVDVEYLRDYKLHLKFNDGSEGIVDLASEVSHAPYTCLKDPQRFIAFGLEYGTLVWSSELDISAEYLRSHLQ